MYSTKALILSISNLRQLIYISRHDIYISSSRSLSSIKPSLPEGPSLKDFINKGDYIEPIKRSNSNKHRNGQATSNNRQSAKATGMVETKRRARRQ